MNRRRCIIAVLVASVLGAFCAGAGGAAGPPVGPVVLPRDQGAHPSYGIEWWYTSGTLSGTDHRSYFWFATIWSADGAQVARLNVVDLGADRTVLSREYVDPTQLTVGQTSFRVGAFALGLRPEGTGGRWYLNAATGGGGRLKLVLAPHGPYIRHGRAGIIQQGTGGHSAYYSAPRLAARGTLTRHGAAERVRGQGWLDHQWGDFGTDVGALRWNWFACQCRDGGDLMLYQFLDRRNRPTGRQTGTLVTRAGRVTQLRRFAITPLGRSVRPAGATARYPLAWRLRVSADRLALTVRARARNQFIVNRFVPSFWEAASEITAGSAGTCTVESSREIAAVPR